MFQPGNCICVTLRPVGSTQPGAGSSARGCDPIPVCSGRLRLCRGGPASGQNQDAQASRGTPHAPVPVSEARSDRGLAHIMRAPALSGAVVFGSGACLAAAQLGPDAPKRGKQSGKTAIRLCRALALGISLVSDQFANGGTSRNLADRPEFCSYLAQLFRAAGTQIRDPCATQQDRAVGNLITH